MIYDERKILTNVVNALYELVDYKNQLIKELECKVKTLEKDKKGV